MKRGPLLFGVGVLVLLLAAFGVKRAVDSQRPQGSDDEQVRQMLYDGERAAERRDAGGVTQYLSPNYNDGNFTGTQVRFRVAEYFRRQQSVELNIPSELVRTEFAPDGKTGTVRFRMQVGRQEGSGSFYTDVDMTLHLVKEPVFYFGVFPGEEWRVIKVEGWEPLDL